MSLQDELLALATELAHEAGAGLSEAFGRALAISAKSTPTDLVSEADLATERLIRARLEAARPDDAILGEEGDDRPGTSGLRWVVDPLDGTVNFLFGIPVWSVSVACEDSDGVLAGVVFDPLRGETWAATRPARPACGGSSTRSTARSTSCSAFPSGPSASRAKTRRARSLA